MKQLNKWMCVVACVLLVVSLGACGAKPTYRAASDGELQRTVADGTEKPKAEAMYDSASAGSNSAMEVQSVYHNAQVKLIRRANLHVQTVEFDRSVTALEQLVLNLNGYYETSELSSGGYYDRDNHRSGRYVVRIPAQSYDLFMEQIGGVGYLSRRSESTQDVGQEYFDVESRLATQRTKQERLQQLLKQAGNMEDIIAIEHALSDVEYQIEQYTSQIKRYDSLIGYSTITVNLQEVQRITEDPGQRAGLGQRIKTGFASSVGDVVDGIQSAIVWVSYNIFGIAVVLVVVGCGVFLGRRRIIKKRKNPAIQDGEQT